MDTNYQDVVAGSLVHYLDSPDLDLGLILRISPEPTEPYPLLICWGNGLDTDQYAWDQVAVWKSR